MKNYIVLKKDKTVQAIKMYKKTLYNPNLNQTLKKSIEFLVIANESQLDLINDILDNFSKKRDELSEK